MVTANEGTALEKGKTTTQLTNIFLTNFSEHFHWQQSECGIFFVGGDDEAVQ